VPASVAATGGNGSSLVPSGNGHDHGGAGGTHAHAK
jgi:hypothetical protein